MGRRERRREEQLYKLKLAAALLALVNSIICLCKAILELIRR